MLRAYSIYKGCGNMGKLNERFLIPTVICI